MPDRVAIAASILAADPTRLAEAVGQAEAAGADAIHVDIMDGHYVHNLTFGIHLFPVLRRCTRLPLAAHLEIEHPGRYVEDFVRAGASMLIVQEDACPNLASIVARIVELGAQVGVAVNPNRPLGRVVPLMHTLDLVLCMSVPPGFGGQRFHAEVLPKVAQARRLARDLKRPPLVGMDGGLGPETVPAAVRAGANLLVVGTAIFHSGAVAENMAGLRQAIARANDADGNSSAAGEYPGSTGRCCENTGRHGRPAP